MVDSFPLDPPPCPDEVHNVPCPQDVVPDPNILNLDPSNEGACKGKFEA